MKYLGNNRVEIVGNDKYDFDIHQINGPVNSNRLIRCKSKSIWKSGFIRGKQRYECKDCAYHFSQDKQKGFSDEIKAKAIQLYLEGLGFRAIGRFLGVSQVSVVNWVKAAGNLFQMSPPEKVEVVECDEMCITIGEKNKKFGYGSVFAVSVERSSGMCWVIVQREAVKS